MSSYNNLIFRDLDDNGNVISKPMRRYKNRRSVVAIDVSSQEEKYFESILNASNILHLDRCSIHKCLKGDCRYSIVGGYIWREVVDGEVIENNLKITDIITDYNKTNPEINGERHNIKEWCKIFDISTHCFYYRRKQGMSIIEALTLPKRR